MFRYGIEDVPGPRFETAPPYGAYFAAFFFMGSTIRDSTEIGQNWLLEVVGDLLLLLDSCMIA